MYKWENTKRSWFRFCSEIFYTWVKMSVHIKLVEKNILISNHYHYVWLFFHVLLLSLSLSLIFTSFNIHFRWLYGMLRIENKTTRPFCNQKYVWNYQRNVSIFSVTKKEKTTYFCCSAFTVSSQCPVGPRTHAPNGMRPNA